MTDARLASGEILAFAHRGGALHPGIPGLENTLAAFRHAVDLGYRQLETDVHLTSDGVLVAFHDEDLDRVTDATGRIAELPWERVRQARIAGTHPIPTLAELFDAFPAATFHLDLKAPGTPRALAEFLRARDAWHRAVVGSFSERRLREFRRLTRGAGRTATTPAEIVCHLVLPWRLARALTGRSAVSTAVPHHAHPLGLRVTVASRRFVAAMHRSGLAVYVWTIDDPAEMTELLDRGVDGLMTDRTDLLKELLVARGQWQAGEAKA